jgi:hypothetical protein
MPSTVLLTEADFFNRVAAINLQVCRYQLEAARYSRRERQLAAIGSPDRDSPGSGRSRTRKVEVIIPNISDSAQ